MKKSLLALASGTLGLGIADVYLCGRLVCGVSSSAIIVAAELQRKRNDGSGLCADCFQLGKCSRSIRRRTSD